MKEEKTYPLEGWWRRKRCTHWTLLVPRAPAPNTRGPRAPASVQDPTYGCKHGRGYASQTPHFSHRHQSCSQPSRPARHRVPAMSAAPAGDPLSVELLSVEAQSPLRASEAHNSSQRCDRLWASTPCYQEFRLILCKLAVPTRKSV